MVTVAQVFFSEMWSGDKMGSPPTKLWTILSNPFLGRQRIADNSHFTSEVQRLYEVKQPELASTVWVKVTQVCFSEMLSGVKIGSPPGFLCHTNSWTLCIFKSNRGYSLLRRLTSSYCRRLQPFKHLKKN